MRVFSVFFILCFCHTGSQAQTFTGTGGSIPGTSTSQTCFTRNVTGVGTINGSYGLASVCINITHPNDDELEIVLTAPDGTVIPLSIQNGGSGNNYTNTCFTATATNPIKFGTAPFNGTYLPEGYLGAVNNGQNANGNWRLCIQDRRTAGNAGTLNSWSLTFNNNPAPVPPVLPSCTNTLPSTSSCSTAALVCDFNGQCGSTSGTTVQDWTGSGLDGCFGLQNNSFIRFIASATTASFSVWVPTTNNTAAYNQGGIQMLFFSGTCNSGAVTTYGCYPHILPYSGTGQPLITVVTAQGLTPGNTYYLMIDGFNNDNCNFTIAANSGVNVLNISPAAPAICNGNSVNLTATGGNGVYAWSPAAGLNTTTGATVAANPTGTTTYTVTSTTPAGCPITKDILVTVNPLPAAPTASVTAQPNCTAPSGTITISAPLGAGLEYSVNGTAYQASPVFTGLTPNITYHITVRNISTGCISPEITLTMGPPASTPVTPTASATAQPTCTGPTGTITVTAPTGPGLQYSIGGPYQASPIFTGLTQNVYNVTVQNGAGCTSPGTSVSINAVPAAPPAPAASVTTAPTCTIPTGVITISAPLGAGLEYSIDGINYQASPVFSAVNPNSYNVTVRNGDCISAATIVTVAGGPAQAPGPIVGTVHPTCNQQTGTILITPPAGSNLEYSINGTFYQASPTFNNVAPGNYIITVRNTVTGCISIGTSTTVNPPPASPATPTGSVTGLPDCNNSGGTISITAPVGPDYEYSSNGGISYQSSPVFTNLTPLSYSITVRNTVSGCVSQPLLLTVAAGPVRPEPPTLTTIQPDCAGNPGSITVTAPLGAGLQYSMNGSAYQSSTTFANLTEALYLVKVKDATGCESFATPAIILQSAGLPPKPVIVQVQPVCPQLTGTITITSPVAGNIEYSLNGSTYQSSNIFTNVAGGNYNITARFTGTPCVSAATTANIKGLTPDQCLAPANGEIYFPTAFTPNGDMLNDGFGPGPRSNLSAVSSYTLMVFNRYGELVFKTTDPLVQWDGKFKGKMLANNSFTWVASYRYGTRPLQIKKGTITVIR